MDIRGFVIFCITILPLASSKERSVAECNDYSGKVYYDPADGVCKCDRSKCLSRRDPPGIKVREEECVYLYGLDCREGMQPDPSETKCVPCPDGTFKSEIGCDWCTQMTICADTQLTVFNGNRTTDRNCSDTKPELVTRSTVNYPEPYSSTDTHVNTTTTTTTAYMEEMGNEISTLRTGSTNSSGFMYLGFAICGAVLFAIVLFAGLKKSCVRRRSSRQRSEHFPHDVEKQTLIWRGKDQTYTLQVDEAKKCQHVEGPKDPMKARGETTIGQSLVEVHQVDEVKKCEHAERPKDSMKARGEATIGQSLDEGMHQTTPKICEYSSTGVEGKKIKDTQEIEDRSSSLGLSSVLNDRFTLSERT